MSWPSDEAVVCAAQVLDQAYDQHIESTFEDIARRVLEVVGLPSLMGVKDAAEMLGVATGNLDKQNDLPRPQYPGDDGLPSGGRLWLTSDIVDFAKRREAKKDG